MKNDYGMTVFGGGPSSFLDSSGTSFMSAIKNDILDLIYHGQYIKAKEQLGLAMIEAKKEERLAYIRVLQEIASDVEDDCIREQMFKEIWMLCAREM